MCQTIKYHMVMIDGVKPQAHGGQEVVTETCDFLQRWVEDIVKIAAVNGWNWRIFIRDGTKYRRPIRSSGWRLGENYDDDETTTTLTWSQTKEFSVIWVPQHLNYNTRIINATINLTKQKRNTRNNSSFTICEKTVNNGFSKHSPGLYICFIACTEHQPHQPE